MGVKDLAAVILKHAPNASTPHTSLASFRGKTLALDANLLTIKFHHRKPRPNWTQSLASTPPANSTPATLDAPDPSAPPSPIPLPFPSELDPHRHVKSWHKFLTELQALDIKPIVVFDGSTRVPEKARENERRAAGRELQRSRGRAERVRSARLREVKEVWDGVKVGERWEVAREFVGRVGEAKVGDRLSAGENDATDGPQPSAQEPVLDPPIQLFNTATTTHGPDDNLARLYSDFQADTSNPIYSKNQLVISNSESQFFADLFNIGLLPRRTAPDPTLPPVTSPVTSPQPVAAQMPTADKLEAPAVAEIPAEEEIAPVDTEGAVVVPEPAKEAIEEAVARLPPVIDVEHEEAEDMDLGLEAMLRESERLGASHIARGEGVPKQAFADSLSLIRALGIPYLLPPPSSPTEAESLCSTLCTLGLADYVVSEDTDVTVYGAPLLRQVGVSQHVVKTKRGDRQKGMNVLDPVEVQKGLGMTRPMFVDFCLLCGTDFTERLKGLGPMTAVQLIRKHTSIEAILANHPPALTALAEAGTSPSAYLQTVHAARALFLTPAPVPAGLPDDWFETRQPSEDLNELLAGWGIGTEDGKPKRAARRSGGWLGDWGRVEEEWGLEDRFGREGGWEGGWEEGTRQMGLEPPLVEAWDEGQLDRLAERAARM